jgi:hypothetical protein
MSFTTRFAHLIGLSALATATAPLAADVVIPAPAAAAKKYGEDDRDPERMENESDEDYGKRCDTARAEESEEEEPKEKKGKKGAKKVEKDKEESDDDDDKDDDKRAELTGNSMEAQARDRERERCAAILSHPKAAVNLGMALSLAFDTRMTRKEAGAVLDKLQAANVTPLEPPRTSRSQLAERLAAEPAAPIVKPGAAAPAQDTPEARAKACMDAAEALRWK